MKQHPEFAPIGNALIWFGLLFGLILVIGNPAIASNAFMFVVVAIAMLACFVFAIYNISVFQRRRDAENELKRAAAASGG